MCFHGYISPSPNLVHVAEVSGNTIGQCLGEFIKLYPSTKKLLFEENGNLGGYFGFIVNESWVYPEEINKPIEDGDELRIVALFDGG